MQSITTVNNVKMSKRDVIFEIKSRRSASFHKTETVKNENNRIIAQRIHFAAPDNTAKEIQDFFGREVIKDSDYTFYLEFESIRPNFKK